MGDNVDAQTTLTVQQHLAQHGCQLSARSVSVLQADGGVSKKIIKVGSGWETPEAGDQVFGESVPWLVSASIPCMHLLYFNTNARIL